MFRYVFSSNVVMIACTASHATNTPAISTPMEGHAFCGGGPNPPWGEDVLSFLREAGM